MKDANVTDFAELRRIKKKRRNMQKFLGFMAILVIALGLYVSRERWVPNVNSKNTLFSDNEISGGNFPLSITNGINYQTCRFGDVFVLLSDTRFYIYSITGELLETRQHTYSNTVLKHSSTKALVYEQGGSNFKVEGKRKTVYEKKIENSICMAAISEKGYVAVVSSSDQYVCELTVYDAKGTEIYFRGCVERIMDVAFNKDSTGCSIITINANEGQMVSKATSLEFESNEDKWQTDELATCCISAYTTDDGGLFVFGDTQCAYYNNKGECKQGYIYGSTLIDAMFVEDKAAMIFESEERRKTSLVMISSHNSDPVEITIDKNVKCIFAEKDEVYIMTENAIEAYSYSGKLIKSKEISENYREFYKIDNYMLLLGYNKIDMMEFEIKSR